jgi:hypothetical protein
MPQEPPTRAEVERLLEIVGVESLCQWDVLVFLYRHQMTLVGADYLAGLLGHATDMVIAALEALESRGLIARSRVSQGARLYEFTGPTEPPLGTAFRRLLDLADDRTGRVHLSDRLRREERTPQAGLVLTARGFLREPRQVVSEAQQQVRQGDEGRAPWLKVI